MAAAALLFTPVAVHPCCEPLGPEYDLFVSGEPFGGHSFAGSGEDRFLLGWWEPLGGELVVVAIRHDGTVVHSGIFGSIGHSSADPLAVSAGALPGEFVLLWEDFDSPGLFARRASRDGQPLGGEFPVSSIPQASPILPALTPWHSPAGEDLLLAGWASAASFGNDNDSWSVQARTFTALGAPLGPEFQLNTHIEGGQLDPSLAASPRGHIVAVWESETSPAGDDDGLSVQGRLYDGTSWGSQFQVNTTEGGDQDEPSVAMQADGSFLVTWQSESSPGRDEEPYAVIGRAFGPDGQPLGSDFQVNETTAGSQHAPQLAAISTNAYELVWDGGATLRRRCYSVDGQPLTGELEVNTSPDSASYPVIATGLPTHSAVAWLAYADPFSLLRGRSFSATIFTDGFETGDTSVWDEVAN